MNELKEYIRGIGWAKFIAVMTIVGGALSIPVGILSIIAGIKLWSASNSFENYKNTEREEDLKDALKNLSEYFVWMGWMSVIGLIILALVTLVILIAFSIAVGIEAMSGTEF